MAQGVTPLRELAPRIGLKEGELRNLIETGAFGKAKLLSVEARESARSGVETGSELEREILAFRQNFIPFGQYLVSRGQDKGQVQGAISAINRLADDDPALGKTKGRIGYGKTGKEFWINERHIPRLEVVLHEYGSIPNVSSKTGESIHELMKLANEKLREQAALISVKKQLLVHRDFIDAVNKMKTEAAQKISEPAKGGKIRKYEMAAAAREFNLSDSDAVSKALAALNGSRNPQEQARVREILLGLSRLNRIYAQDAVAKFSQLVIDSHHSGAFAEKLGQSVEMVHPSYAVSLLSLLGRFNVHAREKTIDVLNGWLKEFISKKKEPYSVSRGSIGIEDLVREAHVQAFSQRESSPTYWKRKK